ncbi:MAG: molybdopterin molybdotransferase MoeA [Hungatella sp.]|jgi:molybdopterin molybdotransferase/putative molybdopterin biosynthesis protein|nr:molybdopterin molybdotransferase MoeA [Hungatella sp.]
MYLDSEHFITRAEAINALMARWTPDIATEILPLEQSKGRICARDVFSQNTLPVCRSSQADGIAVRFADFTNGIPDTSAWKKDLDYAMADTGDDFADAFDTVIQVEDLVYNASGTFSIVPEAPIVQGQLVSPQGSMLRSGELLLKKGDVVQPMQLCLLAAGGISGLEVVKQPVVAYIPTGNELVCPGEKPQRGQNVETNGLMISGYLEEWGAVIRTYPILPDNQKLLDETLADALQNADIILINGGSSKGSEDYTVRLLEKRSTFLQHGIKSIPGIPVALAIADGKPVINLPGPPFAAFCALDWCVRALVYQAQGRAMQPPRRVKAVLQKEVHKPAPYEFYLRLKVYKAGDGFFAEPLSWGSRFAQAMNCNALMVIPVGSEGYHKGDVIEAELLYGLPDDDERRS